MFLQQKSDVTSQNFKKLKNRRSMTHPNIHTYFGTFLVKFVMNYFFQELHTIEKNQEQIFFPRTFQERSHPD